MSDRAMTRDEAERLALSRDPGAAIRHNGLLRLHNSKLVAHTVYKYVDADDAQFLERGSLKIGTSDGYAKLEGPRADPDEGKAVLRIQHITVDDGDHEMQSRLRGIGLGIRSGSLYDCESITREQDTNCLCFSWSPNVPDDRFDRPQAVFKIRNIRKLLTKITESDSRLTEWGYMRVRYRSRESEFDGSALQIGLFDKPLSFAWEKEVRAIWRPTAERIINTNLSAEVIITKDNDAVARMMTRIR